MTHWWRPCCEEDECLMMKPRAWCAAFKASVEFSFSLSPLWPEHLYVYSDVFGLQDCVLKQTSASLLKRWSESSGSWFVESLRGAFTDCCSVFTCQLYLFTCFKSASSLTSWCLCLNMQDHVPLGQFGQTNCRRNFQRSWLYWELLMGANRSILITLTIELFLTWSQFSLSSV